MIGRRLAHYEITAHLGSGGMGEVYQATDTKLVGRAGHDRGPDAQGPETLAGILRARPFSDFQVSICAFA